MKLINLKKKITKKNIVNKIAAVSSMTMAALTPVSAASGSALTTAVNLLSKGAIAGGGIWAIWGIVQLGMAIKDSDGPGIGKAIWQIVGGAIIIAAGTALTTVDLTLA